MSKPHIWFARGRWYCHSGWETGLGVGLTPVQAYQIWHSKQ